jgi:hypothetical protein
VDDPYDVLPDPAALSRTAIVKYCCGSEFVEVSCSAASIRTLEWEDTHQPVTWLHCVAAHGDGPKGKKSATTMKLLIPAQYITSIEAGPKVRAARTKPSADVGIFPPEHPNPANQLPLTKIEEIIAALQVQKRKRKAPAAAEAKVLG